MARERVQVQGLGDAVPGIQPTIQRAGQYGIQMQKAGRNKLQDLAGALSQVNPTLQQYIGVADQEAEIFEEELARKSPEEVQAMLKKTEGELDKQVRRGAMGWLTSPLNQKRKLQAVGALLHDDYERQLKAQIENPANADADANELIASVKDNLRNQYGALQSTFVNEGFEGAIRETTRRYTLHHDTLATAQAREEIKRAGKSVLFNASTLVNNEIADPESINEWWSSNEGSLIPSELSALRKEVIVLHASRGNFEAARKFQEYTANFKAGTTKMGDPDTADDDVFGMYSAEEAKLTQTLDDMELASDARLVADSKLELREYDELAVDIGLAIRTNPKVGYTAKDGTIIKTTKDAETYLLGKLQKSDNILVRGSSGVSVVQNALKSLELPKDFKYIQFGENYGRAEINKGPNSFKFGYESILQDFKGSYAKEDPLNGKYILDPKYETLSNNLIAEIYNKRALKMEEISTGTFRNVEGEEVISSKFKDQVDNMKAWDRIYLEEFKKRLFTEAPELKLKIEIAEDTGQKEGTTGMSFVEPTEKLSDLYGLAPQGSAMRDIQLFVGKGFTGLEKAMREGSDVKSVLKTLEGERRGLEVFGGGVSPSIIGEVVSVVESNKATPEEHQSAKNKLALYIAAKGLYTAENIKNGSVDITYGGVPAEARRMTFKQAREGGYKDVTKTYGGTIVRLPATKPITKNIRIDKQALKELSKIYPLISKERLTEISTTEPEAFPEEQALFEALYDIELEEGNEQDEKLLRDFIMEQGELSQSIYKK